MQQAVSQRLSGDSSQTTELPRPSHSPHPAPSEPATSAAQTSDEIGEVSPKPLSHAPARNRPADPRPEATSDDTTP
jgi:hypothetical protein